MQVIPIAERATLKPKPIIPPSKEDGEALKALSQKVRSKSLKKALEKLSTHAQ